MRKFKDFGIKPKAANFVGDKIKIERILNTPIVVTDFKIAPSTQKPNTRFLTLQIERNGGKNVIFTGSKNLMEMIEQVGKEGFPFETIIIKENESYEFT